MGKSYRPVLTVDRGHNENFRGLEFNGNRLLEIGEAGSPLAPFSQRHLWMVERFERRLL